MNDVNSLSHTSWNCKYHIVFAPKYRRKVMYGEKRKEIGEILRTLCDWKKIKIKDYRSRGVPRPHPHAVRDTTKGSCIKFHGVPQREKQSDDIREVSRAKVQVPESGVLVPRVLRRYSRKKCKEDRGVYQKAIGRG